MYGPNPFPEMPDIEEEKIDLTNPKLKSKNETVGGQQEPQLQNQFFLKEQYEKDCYLSEWFFVLHQYFLMKYGNLNLQPIYALTRLK